MQNAGNTIVYGQPNNLEAPKPIRKVPKLELFHEAYTPKNNTTKGGLVNLNSQAKEPPNTDRVLGRSQSHNIETTYEASIDDLDIGRKSSQSLQDVTSEPSPMISRINRDSPKKKKAVSFKERIDNGSKNEKPPISFKDDDSDEIVIGWSKVKTKFDQHEYLGINLPNVGLNSTNSSSLMLMKLFRKK
jgi:hypothetical protein